MSPGAPTARAVVRYRDPNHGIATPGDFSPWTYDMSSVRLPRCIRDTRPIDPVPTVVSTVNALLLRPRFSKLSRSHLQDRNPRNHRYACERKHNVSTIGFLFSFSQNPSKSFASEHAKTASNHGSRCSNNVYQKCLR
uniref:Uncharacterized protein n=1 Tax=Sipha flava TaxID=143950 RepID=A0A2S2QCR3_9HEMI